jgi:hypothetical protein
MSTTSSSAPALMRDEQHRSAAKNFTVFAKDCILRKTPPSSDTDGSVTAEFVVAIPENQVEEEGGNNTDAQMKNSSKEAIKKAPQKCMVGRLILGRSSSLQVRRSWIALDWSAHDDDTGSNVVSNRRTTRDKKNSMHSNACFIGSSIPGAVLLQNTPTVAPSSSAVASPCTNPLFALCVNEMKELIEKLHVNELD